MSVRYTPAQGIHGSGSRGYTPAMARRVLMVLLNQCVGPQNRKTVEVITQLAGLQGRSLRAVISYLENHKLVLTNFTNGYYVCTTVEEAQRGTFRLESQVRSMTRRIAARREMEVENGLPRLQPPLF